MAEILLNKGIGKNARNELNWTALHEAAYQNRKDCVQLLIVHGADVTFKTDKGFTAEQMTISQEIRNMLKDMASHSPTKQESQPAAPDCEQAKETSEPEEYNSDEREEATKPSTLSRKEDFALLGDLPQFQCIGETQEVKRAKKTRKKKRGRKRKEYNNVPVEIQCAISKKIMYEAMKSPYGHFFDRKCIKHGLKTLVIDAQLQVSPWL